MDKFPLQGGVEAPGAPPGRGHAPRSVAWGARRPPTTRLALTWVIALGGDIYRVGARQGATPPSTPVHEVDSGQGSSGPETDIHIYVQSRPLSLPPPRAPSRARLPANRTILHASHRGLGAPWVPLGPTHGGAWPRRPAPSSLIPSSPRRLPSVHLLLPTGECSGPTETGAPSPPSPFPYARRTPWSPLPIGTHAHDEIPLAHRASRRAVGVPCHAMPCWMDGSAAQVHAASPAARLPSDCHFAAPPRDLDASPPRPPGEGSPPRAVAPVMPCHAIPSTASTVEDHSHADSPTLTGLESCAQAFRGPNSILRGHTNAHKVGHHPASQPSPPLPPSLSTGENRGGPCHLGAQARPPPPPPPPAKSSAPLQCCQLAKGRAH
ncbi:hypothetical protein N7493_009381 [Penicillium malachiteum]|uniref:Uncharacterized protein n=1 Tax=Penicillium malachiteum TaxID=1324776 RepID=A0AAD6MSU1_9EURO|nr:hypothetical protein N7493_009381 [Penicillium malachiteum]